VRELIAVLAAFLIGSIPSAYLWVKIKTGKDIRTMGSGNVGATNVFRSVGRLDGIGVLVLDALKGILGVVLGSLIWEPVLTTPTVDPQLIGFGLGIAAILGHVFTPWLKFKGGKGVATGAGVALAVYPTPFFLAFVVWSVLLKTTRYMSVASIAAAYAFAAATAWIIPNKTHAVIALAAAVFITWTHRANIDRLRKGSETKLFHK
jgi:glycerol-3-phosphate acyltransferase PlsY